VTIKAHTIPDSLLTHWSHFYPRDASYRRY